MATSLHVYPQVSVAPLPRRSHRDLSPYFLPSRKNTFMNQAECSSGERHCLGVLLGTTASNTRLFHFSPSSGMILSLFNTQRRVKVLPCQIVIVNDSEGSCSYWPRCY